MNRNFLQNNRAKKRMNLTIEEGFLKVDEVTKDKIPKLSSRR
jgi:hypothetical protein